MKNLINVQTVITAALTVGGLFAYKKFVSPIVVSKLSGGAA